MALAFAVGGARRAFEAAYADEVALVLDHAFGAEGDWELAPLTEPGELAIAGWSRLVERAVEELGEDLAPNLAAMHSIASGVFLPANVQATAFRLTAGPDLRCASLPGLRNELADLAARWGISLDEIDLRELLEPAADDVPEVAPSFARLALAANEAARRDCPLWLIARD